MAGLPSTKASSDAGSTTPFLTMAKSPKRENCPSSLRRIGICLIRAVESNAVSTSIWSSLSAPYICPAETLASLDLICPDSSSVVKPRAAKSESLISTTISSWGIPKTSTFSVPESDRSVSSNSLPIRFRIA